MKRDRAREREREIERPKHISVLQSVRYTKYIDIYIYYINQYVACFFRILRYEVDDNSISRSRSVESWSYHTY